MGIATFPASSGGLTSAVRSIQRGVAASSGNITISSVDTTKTICNSFSTSSAGSVAATGAISAANGTTSAVSTSAPTTYDTHQVASSSISGGTGTTVKPGGNYSYIPRYGITNFAGYSVVSTGTVNAMNINGANVGLNATNISGGSTSLTSAVYGIYLVNATTINASGPCRYEVIEYY